MIPVFSGKTSNDVWSKAAKILLSSNEDTIDSRTGKTHELLHAVFSISNPRERWVTDRNPIVSIAFALAEVVWILNGSNESQVINYWNPSLKRYAGEGKIYTGAYGYRIRKEYGIDQLERAYHVLKNNPNSRQTVILIWNPNNDLPNVTGRPISPDIPCNICSLLKVRDAKLEWTQIIRSNDIFRGVPYNIVQFTSLQEILAGWLEIEIGAYTQFSDSLHLYNDDKEKLSIIKRNYAFNSDNLALPKPQSDAVLNNMFNRMKVISTGKMVKDDLVTMAYLNSGFVAYDNIMFIISAYVARKLKYEDLKCRFIESCSNKLFCEMWKEWENQNK